MSVNRKGGIALLAGSLGFIVTISLHDFGSGLFTAGSHFDALVLRRTLIHMPAVVSLPLMFLGALALSRRLASPDRLDIAAVVLYGFAQVAALSNVAVDAFVAPALVRQVINTVPPASDTWRVVLGYNAVLNGVFAQVWVVATSAAIVLWSASIRRNRRLALGIAIYGLLLGAAVVIAVAFGQLTLASHWVLPIIVGQVAWFISAGIQLYRLDNEPLPGK